VLHLSFAHPIHGSLLASCSHDRTVRIWEELPASSTTAPGGVHWVERGTLTGAKGGVRVVEFAPPNPAFGLRVASIASDSHLRVHTSLDPDVSDWSLANDVYLPSLTPPGGHEGDVPPPVPLHAEAATPAEAATGGWGLSWCKEKWWGSVLVAFSGNSPVAKIISLDPTPTALVHLKPASSSPLTSIAWAPACGRSYHLIATGSRDGVVRIWRVEPPSEEEGTLTWTAENIAEFGRGPRIGMVEWNATGTTLTTSDDEGQINIYKRELHELLHKLLTRYSDLRQDLEAARQDVCRGGSDRRLRRLIDTLSGCTTVLITTRCLKRGLLCLLSRAMGHSHRHFVSAESCPPQTHRYNMHNR
jgi:nucleoporin SEH1